MKTFTIEEFREVLKLEGWTHEQEHEEERDDGELAWGWVTIHSVLKSEGLEILYRTKYYKTFYGMDRDRWSFKFEKFEDEDAWTFNFKVIGENGKEIDDLHETLSYVYLNKFWVPDEDLPIEADDDEEDEDEDEEILGMPERSILKERLVKSAEVVRKEWRELDDEDKNEYREDDGSVRIEIEVFSEYDYTTYVAMGHSDGFHSMATEVNGDLVIDEDQFDELIEHVISQKMDDHRGRIARAKLEAEDRRSESSEGV